MSDAKRIGEGINEVVERINREELEPEPGRRDWAQRREAISAAVALLEREVLDPLEAALDGLSENDRDNLRFVVGSVSGALAAVLYAAGDRSGFSSLLARACAAADITDVRRELEAATRDPGAFTDLAHARWLRRRGKLGSSERLLRKVAKGSREAALREIALAIHRAPSRIASAPTLFTLNGCGVTLYGKRDPAPDGSYVATTYLALVFVPLLPLASYRVLPQGDRRYLFLGRVPLSQPLEVFRGAVLAAILVGLAAAGITSYLQSPAHRLSVALGQAQSAEKAGRTAEALQGYSEVLATFAGSVGAEALEPAAEGWVRLRLAAVKEPFTVGEVEEVARVELRLEQVPPGARAGPPAALLIGRAGAWAKQLSAGKPEDLEGAARLAELALRVAEPAQRPALESLRAEVRSRLAQQLADDWPLDALAQWAQLGAQPAARAGIEAITGRIRSDELLLEAQGDLAPWFASVAHQAEAAALVDKLQRRMASAEERAKDPKRQELLSSGDAKALQAALQHAQDDAELALALAAAHRAAGDFAGAIAILEAQGTPGWLIAPAQRLLAACFAETGQLEKAEAILEHHLARRLPRFQAARQAYASALTHAQEQLMSRARAGGLPKDLDSKLESSLPEAQKRELFDEWLSGELEKDGDLRRLRSEYQREQGAVPASLALGTVKLRRAGDERGDERQRLLKEAESAFLAIRQEAEGTPEFHLGLGQVFHRLGRAEEGDKELASLISSGDEALAMRVSEVYRELGLVPKAREVAKGVFDKGGTQARHWAAVTLAMLVSDLEDRERWLSQAGDAHPVKLELAEVRAERLLREGKRAEADRELAIAADGYARDAAHDGAAANNAALVFRRRFLATGNPAFMEKAEELLEASVRLQPDNAIALGNLADHHEDRAVFAVVARRVHARSLPLDRVSLPSLAMLLLEGPDADKVAAELRADPHFLRALELSRQVEVLAPKHADPWQREGRWLITLHDQAGLAALGDRLARAGALDTTFSEEELKAQEDGKRDERTRQSGAISLQLLAKVREQEAAHAPTLAAASVFEAAELEALADLDLDPERAREEVEAWRRAAKAWPQLGLGRQVARALFEEALLRACRESTDLKKAFSESFHTLDSSVIAWKACRDSPQAREALRHQPALQEAVQLSRALPPDRLGTSEWFTASLTGDAATQAAAAAQLTSARHALEEELRLRLGASPASARARAEMLAAVRAP